MNVEIEGGKYTYIMTEKVTQILRYGELWKDATGDKFTYCMAAEIEALRVRNADLEKDAWRYQVLRDSEYQLHEDDPCVSDSFFNSYYGEDLDAAVDGLKARYDAAIEQQKEGV